MSIVNKDSQQQQNDNNNNNSHDNNRLYRTRIAPSPSGYLHKGHAHTFTMAYLRSQKNSGTLILRIEDIDHQRCKDYYLNQMIDDIKWLGIYYNEGYDYPTSTTTTKSSSSSSNNNNNEQLNYLKSMIYNNNNNNNNNNNHSKENFVSSLINHISTITSDNDSLRSEYTNALLSYKQSDRLILYKYAWYYLFNKGYIYPSKHSRKDVDTALSAPHNDDYNKTKTSIDNEIIFPKSLRPSYVKDIYEPNSNQHFPDDIKILKEPTSTNCNWRYRVPDMKKISFHDKRCGDQTFQTDNDFGDYLVWRLDGYPSYELAVVVDDILMNITEVVRGEDLLLSTARQLLIYSAFGINPPDFYHCPLVRDPITGKRLSKSEKSLSIKELRASNVITNVDTISIEMQQNNENSSTVNSDEAVKKEEKMERFESVQLVAITIDDDVDDQSHSTTLTSRCISNTTKVLETLACCPCFMFSVFCLIVAVDRDNDRNYCICCNWDFCECRQD